MKIEVGGIRANFEKHRNHVRKKRFSRDSKWQTVLAFILVFQKFKEITQKNMVAWVRREIENRKIDGKYELLKTKSRAIEAGNLKGAIPAKCALNNFAVLATQSSRSYAKKVIGVFFEEALQAYKKKKLFDNHDDMNSFYMTTG